MAVLFHNNSWNVEFEGFEHFSNEVVDLDVFSVDARFFWDEVHLSVSLFFLELEGDASDWTLMDSAHQVSGVSCDHVSKSLGLDDGDVVNNSLVQMEIGCQSIITCLEFQLSGHLQSY